MRAIQGVTRYRQVTLAIAVVLACVAPSLARGETYGQLAHFGASGTSHGDFDIRKGDNAFGVDPTDNSVYVGDEPGAKKGEYRIQKLTASGSYVAQTALFKPPNHDGIEGIAVDPVEKRIYVLALEKRSEAATIDPGIPAAGTLYAFSTEPSGGTLVPASGTNAEGVLTEPSVLEAQSDVPERALLNPKGIAVDPVTHDVIILGEIYRAVEKGHEESPTLVALQQILPDGALGERYIDTNELFGPNATPNSPVVSATGEVYVAIGQVQILENEQTKTETEVNELAQIPTDFSSTAPPVVFGQFALSGKLEAELDPIVELPQFEHDENGDALSFTTDGPDGESAIFAKASVFVVAGGKGAYYPGALAFDGTSGSELGWTGGQIKKVGSVTPCAIGFGGETYSEVAAGSKGMLFIFAPASTGNPVSEVMVFGPGGSGCPAAQASEPSAEVDGKSLPPAEVVSTGVPVTFSSQLTQANALSVEWNFGDGQTETDSADEYQHTEVTHSFVRGGELTVTETIHTDDLATPTIVEQTKVSVSSTAPPPTAVLEGPTEVILGSTEQERLVYLPSGELGLEKVSQDGVASFNASASTASSVTGPNRIAEYHWVFGDGASETTSTETVEHKYSSPGIYTVALTVTDALGHTSQPATLTVKVKDAPPPIPKTPINPGTSTAPQTSASGAGSQQAASKSGGQQAAVPDAQLASTSLTVSHSGAVALDVTCPSTTSSCTGKIMLRTTGPVTLGSAGSHSKKKPKPAVLTLASENFTVTGGRQKSLTLHLTAKARALLANAHVLHARATLTAHDPGGASHITQTLVTLRAAKTSSKRGK